MWPQNPHPLFKSIMHLQSRNTLFLRVLHVTDTVQVLLSTAELELVGPKKSDAVYSALKN